MLLTRVVATANYQVIISSVEARPTYVLVQVGRVVE
ncbi:hypothetical protein ANO14919_100220 [Xylariales sp. No.14919]|nr:hypothetical protein ANO14919_100220 [Xylariales sp. No.14919]